MVRKSRLLGIAAALTAAGLALAGCSGSPGAAAVVDGQRISEQSLATSADALRPFLSNELSPGMMLNSMIQAPVLLEVAADHGVAASDDDAEQFLNGIAAQAQLPAPETYPAGTLEVARVLMVQQALQSNPDAQAITDEVGEELATLDVRVNPRYGEWDAESGGQLVPHTPDWILNPADSAETPAG